MLVPVGTLCGYHKLNSHKNKAQVAAEVLKGKRELLDCFKVSERADLDRLQLVVVDGLIACFTHDLWLLAGCRPALAITET